MTHDRGKSDNRVVPEKSSNKAGYPAAEGMEGRRLAKGNLREHTMLRTQGWARRQSALARVRQAATKDQSLRFTALLHHIYSPDTLREAYFGLKRDAAPGVDGVRWRHYGENLEENPTIFPRGCNGVRTERNRRGERSSPRLTVGHDRWA